MVEKSNIFMDPYSPEEQEMAETLRKKIAGYPGVVVKHVIERPPIVHQPVMGADEARRVVELKPKPKPEGDIDRQAA